MKGVSTVPDWQEKINLVYLANLPGDFLIKKGVIEQHYQTRIKFARDGGGFFMKLFKTKKQKGNKK